MITRLSTVSYHSSTTGPMFMSDVPTVAMDLLPQLGMKTFQLAGRPPRDEANIPTPVINPGGLALHVYGGLLYRKMSCKSYSRVHVAIVIVGYFSILYTNMSSILA